MSEPGANIDLLFRNGLKDFEVLPPPEVWDSICSSGKIKRHPIVFFRVAAVAAVLMSVGFLTFRLSRETATVPDSTLAFNIEKSYPVIHNEILRKEAIPTKQITNISASAASERTEYMHPISIEKQTVSTESIVPLNSRSNLTLTNSESSLQSFLNPQNSSGSKTLYVRYTDLQYMPADKLVDRWSIAAMASPTYYSQFNSGSDAFSKELMKSEQPLVSYSGGVAFSYKISKRFSIQSGLYYSSLGQKVDGINSFSGFQPYGTITKGDHNFEVLTTNGTVFTNNPDVFLSANGADRIVTAYTNDVFDPKKASLQPVSTSLDQNFKYLEFPVVLKYRLIDKTIGINLIGGLSYNLLVSNSVSTTVDGNKYSIGKTQGLNPLTLSSSLGTVSYTHLRA